MAGVGTLGVGAITTSGALTYGGVTLNNAVTGTGDMVLSTSPTLVTPALGTPTSVTLTNATDLPISTGVSGLGTGVATFLGTPSSANLAAAVTDETGTGALVFATSPTLVTPALGTPSSATLTNATGLPISTGVSGLGTGVATALAVNVGTAGAPVVNGGALGTPSSGTLTNATGLPVATGISGLGSGVATFLATPSSANLRTAVTDETGTGALVFADSPTLVTPALGTPASGVVTNLTGTASININGTVGATTANTGAFTTLTTTGNTTLGDAATDTVTVNGYMGVGATPSSTTSLFINSTALTGVSQTGIFVSPTGTSAATGTIAGVIANPKTAAASFTAGQVRAFEARDATLGAGSTITNQHGLYIADQTQGTNNYGITSLVSSGTNKWNIYASGTAANYFAGNVGIGTSSPATRLDVTGAANSLQARFGSVANRGLEISTALTGVSTDSTSVLNARGNSFGNLVFQTDSTERLRITSAGNVGIGTSSPGSKLHVMGAGNAEISRFSGTVSERGLRISDFAVSGTNEVGYNFNAPGASGANGTLTFSTNSTERLRIDSSGNLFVGATTSPESNVRAYFAGVNAGSGDGVTRVGIQQEASTVSARNYLVSGVTGGQNPYFAIETRQNVSPFAVLERLRIDSAGNTIQTGGTNVSWVGVNAETLGGLSVKYSAQATTSSGPSLAFINDDNIFSIRTPYTSGAIKSIHTSASNGERQADLAFYAHSGGASQSGSLQERLRITSAGNVGIGTTSPNASAILDAQSTTKGVRMPNMTTTEKNAIASPAAGLMVYDTTLAKLCVYTTAWETITSI
jgi:hypothetical protein